MAGKIAVIALYFIAVTIVGYLARSRKNGDAAHFFLGGRASSFPLLLATMAATNFSAFTVFGASGAGYRDGLSFLPVMAFGTGFMALAFLMIGPRIRALGAQHNLITPAELIGVLYSSKMAALLFAIPLVIFTLPYLALQPYAGGLALNSLFGLPVWAGASIITIAILLYTLRGGYRAVALTDVLQGLFMLIVMVGALIVVAVSLGGWTTSLNAVREVNPALFARPGLTGAYTPYAWFGFLLLWFFCDPMFPQLFQRFYTAKSDSAIIRMGLVYPLICVAVFVPPVVIGVLGHLYEPNLTGRAADSILPIVAQQIGGGIFAALVIAAGISALMSTMDSQLLTLSSIISRDFSPFHIRISGRIAVAGLALIGLGIALSVSSSILDLGMTAFTGLAALFPTVFFGLYLSKPDRYAAATSLILGECAAFAGHFGLLPYKGAVLAIPVIAASVVGYLIVQAFRGGIRFVGITRRDFAYALCFAALFAAALDFWRWGEIGGIFLGLPIWVWWSFGLSGVQTLLVWQWARNR